jgi:GTP diphosphokinase / guanosine-3',5'-bis(diphosphate) 3'-diphosphatase
MADRSDNAFILRALKFAASRHRKQFRKGLDRIPYINHPIEVASLLANEGGECDPELLAAAILHDVIEDTVETVAERDDLSEQIRVLFGEKVLSITLEVTDDKTIDKEERKRLQVVHAPFITLDAKKLKIADKIMNVHDITYNPPADWSIERIASYFDWAESVVAGLRGVNQRLEDLFDETLATGRLKYNFSGHVT